jgi:hypothetical protein
MSRVSITSRTRNVSLAHKGVNMNKVIGILVCVFASLFSVQSFADSSSGPYLVTEFGTLRYAGLVPPSGTEAEILNTPGVSGSYEVKDKGSYGAIGLGWHFNKYFSVDVAWLRGVKMSTTTKVSGANIGTINVGGQSFMVGNVPTNITLNREAEASAFKVGINGEYPVNTWLGVTASAEVYQWKASVVNKLTVDASGFYVGYNESDSGTSPAVGLGFVIKPMKGVDIALQYRHINKVTMPSLTLRYSL